MRYEVVTDKIDLADELEEDFRKEAPAPLRTAVAMYADTAKANLRRTGSRVSEPGETPGMDRGELERSIQRGPVRLGRDKRSVTGLVLSSLSYEEVFSVEYGHVNRDGTRTLPRPFLRPTDETAGPKIAALLEELVTR
jgi:hypothetical protein